MMNWLLLVTLSSVSAAVILYVLWPRSADDTHRRLLSLVLALGAILIPATLNYYIQEEAAPKTVAGKIADTDNFFATLPVSRETVWSGAKNITPPPAQADMSLEGVTARLEEKLAQNPENIGGWILLARSYAALGQPEKSKEIFRQKLEDYPDNTDLLLSYSESLAKMNAGRIPEEAVILLQRAEKLAPGHPRVAYNLALFDIQQENFQPAYDRLKSLLDNAPQNASWTADVRKQFNITAEKLGLAETGPASQAWAAPPAEAMAQADRMSAEEKNAFIQSMVDGLAQKLEANPDDLQGWLRLGRSYGVLQNWTGAEKAYRKALALRPDDVQIKKLLSDAELAARVNN